MIPLCSMSLPLCSAAADLCRSNMRRKWPKRDAKSMADKSRRSHIANAVDVLYPDGSIEKSDVKAKSFQGSLTYCSLVRIQVCF